MSQPEADLKAAIVDALRRLGLFVRRNETGSRRYKVMGMGQGSADLLVVLKPSGRAVFLEVKVDAKSKPTANQLAFGDEVAGHGGVYRVVRSVAEAIAVVREVSARANPAAGVLQTRKVGE